MTNSSTQHSSALNSERSNKSQLRRLPARGSHELATIHEILDAGFMAHVGFCIEGQPFVIPTLFGRCEDKLYLHGSAASRMLRHLETGAQACVNVTLVDGLVLARSAFHHSMNYRSVVAFGIAKKITDKTNKVEALRVISEHLVRGRWSDVRQPNETELKQTSVLEFSMEEASAKVRTGPVGDEEEDYALPMWAGVVPLGLRAATPEPDSRLAPGTELPGYLRSYLQRKK